MIGMGLGRSSRRCRHLLISDYIWEDAGTRHDEEVVGNDGLCRKKLGLLDWNTAG
jgi:hypothetical protein